MIKVHFPHGGVWRMLRWHEADCGHHLIMARTHKGVMAALRAALVKEPDLEIRGYWEIDVVAPSPKMNQEAEVILDQHAEAGFRHYIESVAYEMLRMGVELPKPLRACDRYQQRHEHSYRVGEESRKLHIGCKNCERGVIIDIPDFSSFFKQRRAAIEAHEAAAREVARAKLTTKPNRTILGEPVAAESRAVPAKDGKAVRAALAEFGPHCEGVVLKDFKVRPSALHKVLFLYKHRRRLSAEEPKALVREVSAKAEADRKERLKVSAAKYIADRAKQFAEFRQLMGGNVTSDEYVAELKRIMTRLDELARMPEHASAKVNGTTDVARSLYLAGSYIQDAAFVVNGRRSLL